MFTLLADWQSDDPAARERDWERMVEAHRKYDAYLRENASRFPASALSYASAEWRNDFSDHRAPHDSWVKEVHVVDTVRNDAQGNRNPGKDLEIVLLGAYHDGHLHLRYRRVRSFSLSGSGLIEVYRDEVRLSEGGSVLHEIEFLGRENWLIDAEDIEWEWRACVGADG